VGLNLISSVAWELVVGPVRVAYAPKSPAKVWKNIKHNAGQIAGPDQGGTRFGSFYSVREAVQMLMEDPQPLVKVRAFKPPLGQHTVAKDDWLSTIARTWYGDMNLWPAIYDANRDQIADPNKIKPGWVLTIPDLSDYTPEEKTEILARAKAWKPSR
jgi:nucleoid-associated protein YgaU